MTKREESLHRIAELLIKLRLGMLTGEERDELTKWREASPANGKLYERWERGEFLEREYRLFRKVDYRDAHLQMESQVLQRGRKKKVLRLRSWGIVAAAASLLVGILVYFQRQEKVVVPGKPVIARIDGRFPVLELEDGSSVVLDSVPMSFLEAGVAVKKSERLLLSYALPDTLVARKPVYNVLRVPRGAEYDLILSDGSRVWLNAESRLRYPVVFSDSCREVELEGEGYFEVKRDERKPFIVKTEEMDLQVLGTSFNVKAYRDDENIVTTLVTGKIAQRYSEIDTNIILTPSYQAVFNKSSRVLQTKEVDVRAALAWREGRIVMDNARLEDIFRELSRWYDFEIVYTNASLKDMRFYLYTNRYADVDRILEHLQMTRGIHFLRVDKKIYVSR